MLHLGLPVPHELLGRIGQEQWVEAGVTSEVAVTDANGHVRWLLHDFL